MLKNVFFDVNNWSINNESELKRADELRENKRKYAEQQAAVQKHADSLSVDSKPVNEEITAVPPVPPADITTVPDNSGSLFGHMDDQDPEVVDTVDVGAPKKGGKLGKVLKIIGIVALIILALFLIFVFL